LVRTDIRRISSAHPSTVSKFSSTRAWISGTSSTVTRPVVPSIAIASPAASRVPSTLTVLDFRSIASAWAPTTAGRPIPRATSAAWEALPPSEVRIPFAA
jgi:hypothetical protein